MIKWSLMAILLQVEDQQAAYGFAYKLVELLGGDDLAVKKRMVYFNAFDVKEDE